MMFWNKLVDVKVLVDEVLFSLVICVMEDQLLSEVLNVNSCYILVEVYLVGNMMELQLVFVFGEEEVVDVGNYLYQNIFNFFQ